MTELSIKLTSLRIPLSSSLRRCVVYLTFLIIAIFSLPHAAIGILYANSLAPGMILSCLIVIVFCTPKSIKRVQLKRTTIIFIILFFSHFVISIISNQNIYLKSALSISPFILVLLSGFILADRLSKMDGACLEKGTILTSFLLLGICLINTIFKFRFLNYVHHSAIIPFGEASHFAMFYSPFLIASMLFLRSNLSRFFLIATSMLLSIAIPNLTLAAGCILALIVSFRFSLKSMLLAAISLVIFIYFILNNPYFLSRLNVTTISSNLSALVYLQGIYDAANSLIITNFWGLGFQNLGIQPASSIAKNISHIMGAPDIELNRSDGGFLAAKIVAEFGFLGILLIVAYLITAIKLFLKIKRLFVGKSPAPNSHNIFFFSMYLGFSIELFVRGVGYFSPTIIIFFASLFWLTNNSNNDRVQKVV